jgi:flagellar assembly protein FliH
MRSPQRKHHSIATHQSNDDTMATIIRKDTAREAASGRAIQPVAFSFADIRGQADDYLNLVRSEAAKIVQAAHAEAEQIRRRAEAHGRKAAEAAVERVLDEKVASRMQTLLPALDQLISQLNDARGELLNHWQCSAVHVSAAIAQRIIRRELAHDPQIPLELVAEALRLAVDSTDITLHMNPTDYENLGAQVERLAQSLSQLAPSDIVPDPEISPGGCRVQTRFGQIDLQVESQLRRIEQEWN